jgi:hypothetical protein
MFQNRVFRKILELKREEVRVGWIKSHEVELKKSVLLTKDKNFRVIKCRRIK